MIITATQIEQLKTIAFQRFIRETTQRIGDEFPDWKLQEAGGAKEAFVTEVVLYGQKCNITTGMGLAKFVHYVIKYNENIPLSQELEMKLRQPDLNEEVRLEGFCLKLVSGRKQLTLIFL